MIAACDVNRAMNAKASTVVNVTAICRVFGQQSSSIQHETENMLTFEFSSHHPSCSDLSGPYSALTHTSTAMPATMHSTLVTRNARLNSHAYTCRPPGLTWPDDVLRPPRPLRTISSPSRCADRRWRRMLCRPAMSTEKSAKTRPQKLQARTLHGLSRPLLRTSGQALVELRQPAKSAPCETKKEISLSLWGTPEMLATTYHSTDKVELVQLMVAPVLGQLIPLLRVVGVQHQAYRIVGRRRTLKDVEMHEVLQKASLQSMLESLAIKKKRRSLGSQAYLPGHSSSGSTRNPSQAAAHWTCRRVSRRSMPRFSRTLQYFYSSFDCRQKADIIHIRALA